MQLYAVDLYYVFDNVTRGAGNRRDDGNFLARQLVHQARFTDVGLANQNDAYAFPQQIALLGLGENSGQLAVDGGQLVGNAALADEIDIFFRKVETGFDIEAQIDQLVQHLLVQPELLAEELRLAQEALASITGEFTPDDLLGEIFSRFCIGK